ACDLGAARVAGARTPMSQFVLSASFAERYKVIELIGKGSSSSAYRAHSVTLTREAVLKVFDGMNANPDLRARAEREVVLLQGLDHPGIVRVYDHFTDGDAFVLVLEYVRGQSLADRLAAAHRLEPGLAVALMLQIADAVRYLHSRMIVHRDLKPHNIMLRDDGRPVLMDFGIAAPAASSSRTDIGTVLGTPRYMSPEQVL